MSTQLHQASLRRAYFRFYEELNDFLAEERRKQTFCYQFKGNPSIKDTIEAIGIPVPGVGRPANYLTGPLLEPGVPYLGTGLKTTPFTCLLQSEKRVTNLVRFIDCIYPHSLPSIFLTEAPVHARYLFIVGHQTRLANSTPEYKSTSSSATKSNSMSTQSDTE